MASSPRVLCAMAACASAAGCADLYHSREEHTLIQQDKMFERQRRSCEPVLRSLVSGDVYVASGDKTPRARVLRAWECTQRAEQDLRPNFPWLSKVNPSACDKLKGTAPPEAFHVVRQANRFFFEYVGYVDSPSGLRIVEVYSRFEINPYWYPCVLEPFRPSDAVTFDEPYGSVINDKGSAKWWSYGRDALDFVSLSPDEVTNGEQLSDAARVRLRIPHQTNASEPSLFVRRQTPVIGN